MFEIFEKPHEGNPCPHDERWPEISNAADTASHMKVIHVRTMKEDGRICTGGMIMGSVGMSDAVANHQLILI
ncbi:hypothetical protein EVC37_12255 [Methylocaldum sp. BRCS4]|nr:hypothetical protein [Methylocaldum sp. BRCS4]